MADGEAYEHGTDGVVVCRAVGRVVGGRAEMADDHWGGESAVIRLDAEQFGPEALFGLADFSHLEVVYHFDRVAPEKIESGARRPRGNPDWPLVGIFAQRGKNRPNRLGVSRCRVVKVEGLDVHVTGLDAVDGTPVLDIKPYMAEFGPRGDTVQPEWSTELMRDYYAGEPAFGSRLHG
ncbi:SAM-dependent methyltransferase [Streptomyces melanogenes]|uniref:SAM-dependent methyltransferase n=1 Tax=Streptomyces melanogenes TaxID=67326 RepID=UPI00379EFD6E